MPIHWMEITTPEELPKNTFRLGDLIAYSWIKLDDEVLHDGRHLWIWHWCDHSVWKANPAAKAEYMPPDGWSPGGVMSHDFISAEPLHIEPSVFWPGCCGLHGFIRDGKWESV